MTTHHPHLEITEICEDFGINMEADSDAIIEVGNIFPLRGASTVLGRRHNRTDVMLPDRRVSGLHAEIVYEHHQFRIIPLKDNNPILLNGKPLEYQVKHLLVHGDKIGLGLSSHIVFTFCDPDPDGDQDTDIYNPGLRMGSKPHEVWANNIPLEPELDIKEFKLLQILHKNEGHIVQRDDILDHVWGKEYAPSPNQLDKLILQVRKRLEEVDDHPYIKTIKGRGYRLEQPVSEPT